MKYKWPFPAGGSDTSSTTRDINIREAVSQIVGPLPIQFADEEEPEFSYTLMPPASLPNIGRSYLDALDTPSPELHGVIIAVGFPHQYMVYRCNWNDREPEKSSWQFMYHKW